ncbi:General substrate transporter [Niveomyces insectorum RCEF 264]|uniref:General substrate transporter n=1 Tax=Niveomyces insectorum RCEF 264 TaxID=1081102 RepID=A0A167QGS2_9HYPO|nr:General substrate transporter [Niveomyces insectorum RCEF 264]
MLKSHLAKFKTLNGYLLFSIMVYLQGALLFGIDTGSFDSLQALLSFLRRFGVKNEHGAFVLPTKRQSLMNSVENLAPAYCAEIAPSALRGLLAVSITFVVALGNVWWDRHVAGLRQRDLEQGLEDSCSMQLIRPAIIVVLVLFTPESPRRLLLRGKESRALVDFEKLRKKEEVDGGYVAAEIDAIEEAIAMGNSQDSEGWLRMFMDATSDSRRAWIVGLAIDLPANERQPVRQPLRADVLQTERLWRRIVHLCHDRPSHDHCWVLCGDSHHRLHRSPSSDDHWRIHVRHPLVNRGRSRGFETQERVREANNHLHVFAPGHINAARGQQQCVLDWLRDWRDENAKKNKIKNKKKHRSARPTTFWLRFSSRFTTPYLLANPGPNLGPQAAWIFAAALDDQKQATKHVELRASCLNMPRRFGRLLNYAYFRANKTKK